VARAELSVLARGRDATVVRRAHVVAVSSARRWARYGYMGLQGPRCVGNPMVIGKAPHHCECGIPNPITLDPIAAAGLASI